MPKDRRPKAAKRQANRLRKEQLQAELTREFGKLVGWTFFGLILFWTIFAPYIAFGYIKKSLRRRSELRQELSSFK